MTAFILWVLVAYLVLSVLLVIGSVGKRKEPTSGATAVVATVIWAAFIIFGIIPAAIALA